MSKVTSGGCHWGGRQAGMGAREHLEQGLGRLVVLDILIDTRLLLLEGRAEVSEQDGVPHHHLRVIPEVRGHQAAHVLLYL